MTEKCTYEVRFEGEHASFLTEFVPMKYGKLYEAREVRRGAKALFGDSVDVKILRISKGEVKAL